MLSGIMARALLGHRSYHRAIVLFPVEAVAVIRRPKACHDVALAHLLLHLAGNLEQQVVAGSVAQGVVHLLEAAEFDVQHRMVYPRAA